MILAAACTLSIVPCSESSSASAMQTKSMARTSDTWSVGHPAPPLRLPRIDGKRTLDLFDLRGSPVLLLQFASW